jgi:hypothetical protein
MGEVLGVEKLVYNRFVFQSFDRDTAVNAPGVISAIREVFPNCRKLADIGCGSGSYAKEAIRQGLSAVACEYSSYGRRLTQRQGVECTSFDLNKSPPADLYGNIDLTYCFEVAEHLSPELGNKLVGFLTYLSPVIVFSAAQPGQIGIGHINLQPSSYWMETFFKEGCSFNETVTKLLVDGFAKHKVRSPWFFQNVMVFNQTKSLDPQRTK